MSLTTQLIARLRNMQDGDKGSRQLDFESGHVTLDSLTTIIVQDPTGEEDEGLNLDVVLVVDESIRQIYIAGYVYSGDNPDWENDPELFRLDEESVGESTEGVILNSETIGLQNVENAIDGPHKVEGNEAS